MNCIAVSMDLVAESKVSGACFPMMGAFVLVDALSALMQGDKDWRTLGALHDS